MPFADPLRRFGFLLPHPARTVWLFGDPGEIAACYGAVDAALRKRRGYRLILATEPAHLASLRQRYPHETILPLPRRAGLGRWRRQLAPVLLILGRGLNHHARSGDAFVAYDDPMLAARIEALPEPAKVVQAAGSLSPLIRLMAGAPITDLAALKRRLSAPQTILCLGNGPSAENDELDAIVHDALFRVNWIWRARRHFTSPHMVFTADPDRPSGTPIIGFPDRTAGLPILRDHCLRLAPPRQGYAFLDELLGLDAASASGITPTNGAIMIATAAALAPRRIIIAGIDLYEHDAGRYPGDSAAVDGYARGHDRASDLALIRSALANYKGETTIIGEQLRKALALPSTG